MLVRRLWAGWDIQLIHRLEMPLGISTSRADDRLRHECCDAWAWPIMGVRRPSEERQGRVIFSDGCLYPAEQHCSVWCIHAWFLQTGRNPILARRGDDEAILPGFVCISGNIAKFWTLDGFGAVKGTGETALFRLCWSSSLRQGFAPCSGHGLLSLRKCWRCLKIRRKKLLARGRQGRAWWCRVDGPASIRVCGC